MILSQFITGRKAAVVAADYEVLIAIEVAEAGIQDLEYLWRSTIVSSSHCFFR